MTDKAYMPQQPRPMSHESQELSLSELAAILLHRWRLIAGTSVAAAAIGLGAASLLPKWYTASTTILPPQQAQSAAAAAVSQLGALAGLAGGFASVKSPADQYAALMMSATVSNRIIEKFKLQSVYDAQLLQDARKRLKANVRISIGKKDGLISVDVDDSEPGRAAAIANAYVDELREMTNKLAVSEAQQRRMFFERQLAQTKKQLAAAQAALQESGINQGTLKAESKTAAESYARLRAQATAAEVRLQTLRQLLAEGTPEVIQQQAVTNALRAEVVRAEQRNQIGDGADYIDRYREFKYQESLFEIFVKQYELAKVDESREGALIQVVDVAQPPERNTGPRRLRITAGTVLLASLLACLYVVVAAIRRRNHESAA